MDSSATLPVITIEIQGMRHAIRRAMSAHFVGMDKGVQEALEAACKNFDYRDYVMKEARTCIQDALSEAIKSQFRYGGAGHSAVQEVAKKLAKSALKNIAEPA
jgi:hypothetical protein